MSNLVNIHFDRVNFKLDQAAAVPFVGSVGAGAKSALSVLQMISALVIGIFAGLAAVGSSKARSLAAYCFTDLLKRGGEGLILSIFQAIPIVGTLIYFRFFKVNDRPDLFVYHQLSNFYSARSYKEFAKTHDSNSTHHFRDHNFERHKPLPSLERVQATLPLVEREIAKIPVERINFPGYASYNGVYGEVIGDYMTLLHLAIISLDEERLERIVKLLLQQGAIPSDQDLELVQDRPKIRALLTDKLNFMTLAERVEPLLYCQDNPYNNFGENDTAIALSALRYHFTNMPSKDFNEPIQFKRFGGTTTLLPLALQTLQHNKREHVDLIRILIDRGATVDDKILESVTYQPGFKTLLENSKKQKP